MSANAQDIIRIAKEFAEEAYWDLQVAKRLIENLKLDTCSTNDEVFYIGRRVLYMLQQASEKIAKAFLLAYFKSWIEPLIKTVDKEISKADKNKYAEILELHKKLKSLNDKLKPKKIRHAPHKTFLHVICDIYEVFYKEKNYLIKYVQFIFDEFFKQSLEDYLRNYIEKLELPQDIRENIERMCRERKFVEESFPYINKEKLEGFKLLKENYKLLREKFTATEQQIMEIIKSSLNIKEDIWKAIEPRVVTYIKNIYIYLPFSSYLFAYLSNVYLCLALYETAGRYPELINNVGNREKICQDIEKLKLIEEEVEFLVTTIKAGVEELASLI
jgi:hypothetical protein